MKKLLIILPILFICSFFINFGASANQHPTVTFTGDGTKLIGTAYSRGIWQGLISASGTWGGGTISWYWSPDSGTTKYAIKDFVGVAETSSANDSFFVKLPNNVNTNGTIKIYGILAGSSTPSISTTLFDGNSN